MSYLTQTSLMMKNFPKLRFSEIQGKNEREDSCFPALLFMCIVIAHLIKLN